MLHGKVFINSVVCSLLATSISIPPALAQNHEAKNYCQTTPVRSNALDLPSKHAWDLFVVLNHPAVSEEIERGQPDCNLPIGTPGSTSVWETWRNAETEVFLDDGVEPPEWNDNSLPDEGPGTVPLNLSAKLSVTALNADAAQRQLIEYLSFHDASSTTVKPSFSPGDGVFQGGGGFGETRMNRSTYEFVKRNCLWSREGQQRYAAAAVEGSKPAISFPMDSIEVKAAWLDLAGESIPEDHWDTYYSAEYEGKIYGLVALHVLTKDVPNWFWATFHHKDAPDNPFDVHDGHGQPAQLSGTVWENYFLGGTQIDYVTPDGAPTILSDHYVEFGFQRSSCISCHATATAAPDGSGGPSQPMSLCMLNGSMPSVGLSTDVCKSLIGEHLYDPSTDQLWEQLGTPPGSWFRPGGELLHVQTDFLWSLPFRAKSETGQPPARCEW
jgi:hypothetical protein